MVLNCLRNSGERGIRLHKAGLNKVSFSSSQSLSFGIKLTDIIMLEIGGWGGMSICTKLELLMYKVAYSIVVIVILKCYPLILFFLIVARLIF